MFSSIQFWHSIDTQTVMVNYSSELMFSSNNLPIKYEMDMAWEPDRSSNFFYSPPALPCAVIYMTEISLNVTF